MFIHWGLYALAARHEWMMHHERRSDAEYRRYFEHFDPDLYDPAVWAREAAGAGMKYFVVTTKHHEGFALWDTAVSDFKAPNTPCGKDLLAPMVAAFRRENLRVGFYHSLLDWHHPEFPIDPLHPLRDLPEAVKLNRRRDVAKYRAFLHAQTRELLTGFGPIDLLWFDFSYSKNRHRGLHGKGQQEWGSEALLKLVRDLQPRIMVNNRLELDGDFSTPEQFQPREWVRVNGQRVVWEACQTFSGSWGYHRDEESWKSTEMLVQMLIDTVSKGGNLLLNVGPNGRGELDARALDRLRGIGAWMRLHGRSIYGCTQSEFTPPPDGRYTQNGRRLYLHLFAWPFGHVHLPGLAGRVEYAQLLNDASEIKLREPELKVDPHNYMAAAGQAGTLTLQLPVKKPAVTVPVIELFLKG
ncbi:MAG: alpha-L-fucosidase [Planctomycetota bacterium]